MNPTAMNLVTSRRDAGLQWKRGVGETQRALRLTRFSGLDAESPTRPSLGCRMRAAGQADAACHSGRRQAGALVRKGSIGVRFVARSKPDDAESGAPEPPISFGYTRKDVILVGVLLTFAGVGLYYGLQSFLGVNALIAGNVVQIVFVLLLSLGWLSTYLFRVATKNMTYTQQLKDYEEAVMEKRLEEMSDEEINDILD